MAKQIRTYVRPSHTAVHALASAMAIALAIACSGNPDAIRGAEDVSAGGSPGGTRATGASSSLGTSSGGHAQSGSSNGGSTHLAAGGLGGTGLSAGGVSSVAGATGSEQAGTSSMGGGQSAGGGTGANAGGSNAVGGVTSSGGSTSNGGRATSGGSIAGGTVATPTGGTRTTGTILTGGTTATGGVLTGGTKNSGGSSSVVTGGTPVSTGGVPSQTGGTHATTGGSPVLTGGAPGTGGAPATGGSCAATCTLNAKQCPTSSSIQTCISGASGCPTWDTALGCDSPQVCQASGSTAACTCPSVPECTSTPNGAHCSGANLVTCAAVNTCQQSTTRACANVANETCVGTFPNSKCEQAFGYPTDGGSSGVLSANTVYGEQIQVAGVTSLTLTRLGLISAGTGAHVHMALYADNNGSPGNWLASAIGSYTISTLGRNEFAINDPNVTTPVTITAGTYWIFAVTDANVSIKQGTTQVPTRYASWSPWSTAFPNPTFTGLTPDTLSYVNFYVVGVP